MRIRLLTANAIDELGEKHDGAKKYCERFLRSVHYADIVEPKDFVKMFSGNLISGKIVLKTGQPANTVNRVVFDFGGNGKNSYRVICHYQIGNKLARLFVKWTGTHEEYNRLTEKEKLRVGYGVP